MNREDIIRMAREAGIPIETDWAGRPATLVIKDGGTYLRGIEDLERFAALVAAHEREACAKVCDNEARMHEHLDRNGRSRHIDDAEVAKTCAAAIRSRT
jgi:hypothetical protein